MFPKTHIILGFFLSLILYLIFPQINLLEALLIFLSSFLIDFDHYIYYIYKEKDFSLKNSINWFKQRSKKVKSLLKQKRKKLSTGFYLFHGIETLLISFLLGFFFNTLFYFVFIGILFHLILDQIEKFFLFRHPTKISIIFDYFNSHKLNKL